MLMTTFCCGECGTRVEAAAAAATGLLHCPVCSNVLHEQHAEIDDDMLKPFATETTAADGPVVDPKTADDTQSLDEALRRIDRKGKRSQQADLCRPARGPARVPSKRWAIAKVALFALPVVMGIHLLITGRLFLAVPVLICAGVGVCRAGAEYVLAENRELAELRDQADCGNVQRMRSHT